MTHEILMQQVGSADCDSCLAAIFCLAAHPAGPEQGKMQWEEQKH